jgi:putative flavoprotein involved in K+ transport
MDTSRTTRYDTVVVGGGQSGLAAGHYLKRAGRSFLIIDGEARPGDTWRRRWDSLMLFSPAQYDALPGLPFPAPEGTFPTKDEVADYLQTYARFFELPILHNACVTRVTGASPKMIVECKGRRFESRNVIVAVGAYSRPHIPQFAQQLNSGIHQLHSSEYRRPSDVPGATVLVVGFGTSGVEIATELALAGRKVVLSGRPTAQLFSKFVPALFASRHPVGKLLGRAYWALMEDVITVDTAFGRKVRSQAVGRGQPLFRLNQGHAVAAGVEVVPRLADAQNGKARLENGRILEIAAIVWCTGFLPNYPFLDSPALSLDEKGWPVTDHGSAPQIPGLYFLGLPFQVGLTSTLLGGAGRDAELVVRQIVRDDARQSSVDSVIRCSEPNALAGIRE